MLRFHADLERSVRLHTDDHATGLSGPYLEQGGRWREELLEHCATAATMVVLLSETQLDSEWCAREWAVFEERMRRFRSNGSVNGEAAQPLLPLVWTPLSGPLPIAVRERQRLDWVEPVGHADRGVLDLMYTAPDDYRALCFRIGGLVARAAATPYRPSRWTRPGRFGRRGTRGRGRTGSTPIPARRSASWRESSRGIR